MEKISGALLPSSTPIESAGTSRSLYRVMMIILVSVGFCIQNVQPFVPSNCQCCSKYIGAIMPSNKLRRDTLPIMPPTCGPLKLSRLNAGDRVESGDLDARNCDIQRNKVGDQTESVVLDAVVSGVHRKNDKEDPTVSSPLSRSRRSALTDMMLAGTTITTIVTTDFASSSTAAMAAVPEIDKGSGELFSPKTEMLSGGTQSARGLPVSKERGEGRRRARLVPGQALQTVYETRFLSYLSRFLLVFDPAANAWWKEQGFNDSREKETVFSTHQSNANERLIQLRFAEFAESVEVGLADYFLGPYGSYASLAAAKAGISAAAPAFSDQPADPSNIWDRIINNTPLSYRKDKAINNKKNRRKEVEAYYSKAKQGVLNLYALLQARYKSTTAKRQLAILFSMITIPELQPTDEISSLLGESDNATITDIDIVRPEYAKDFRMSSRCGGGYSKYALPRVIIEPPPALGDEYQPAKAEPMIRPTSRVLRIDVTDGGEGYTTPPAVTVYQQKGFASKECEACAILDREGRVESIIVLNPGKGYGGLDGDDPPIVKLSSPRPEKRKGRKGGAKSGNNSNNNAKYKANFRRARAVAELEYEVYGIDVVNGGSGYVATEPPLVYVTPPPDDPDWYVSKSEMFQKELLLTSTPKNGFLKTEVSGIDAGISATIPGTPVDNSMINSVKSYPLELLPSTVRPELVTDSFGDSIYRIPSLPPVPMDMKVPSPQYRAYDDIFGGVGIVPVTKNAKSLKVSEYSRIALSGALCTVLVRTALNPLELVKTKMQLQNDKELNDYAYKLIGEKSKHETVSVSRATNTMDATKKNSLGESLQETESVATATMVIEEAPDKNHMLEEEAANTTLAVGTVDMITSIVKLRGPLALFQSADITLLASVVFGSLGFGATELFRRSFSTLFFSETGGGPGGGMQTVSLLVAATAATVLTSFVASPFELLRVKSMGLVESKSWTQVLGEFLNESRTLAVTSGRGPITIVDDDKEDIGILDLRKGDLPRLFSKFSAVTSRELPFAITKFLVFDLLAKAIIGFINSQSEAGALPVQVGVGPIGLTVSALSGALAGIAGAVVSHPADLILTITSSQASSAERNADMNNLDESDEEQSEDWGAIVKEIISKDGGIANLFVGLPARASFFFLVIGLQFFLYDYVKNLFQVSSDDLTLVLDVFYAVRQGLADAGVSQT